MNKNNYYEINGMMLIDKPTRISSNNLLQKVKQMLNVKKAGYIGTLDPIASGMLPICFGKATKFAQFLSNSDKKYKVIGKFGQKTDTLDSYGKIIYKKPIKFKKKDFIKALKKFNGNITQTPPMYSAIKYKGKPLYQYARQGVQIKRKKRNVIIYNLDIKKYKKNKIELEIHCSKGTYIRTIIDDLGEALGSGAHVIYLRRLQIANYLQNNMITIKKLNSFLQIFERSKVIKKLLIPIEEMIKSI